jgi:zinc/manganese transport system substrate-binding protein
MREAGTLETKPGIEPIGRAPDRTCSRNCSGQPEMCRARGVIRWPRVEWLAERAKIPAGDAAVHVGGSDRAKDLFGLFDDTIRRLPRRAE